MDGDIIVSFRLIFCTSLSVLPLIPCLVLDIVLALLVSSWPSNNSQTRWRERPFIDSTYWSARLPLLEASYLRWISIVSTLWKWRMSLLSKPSILWVIGWTTSGFPLASEKFVHIRFGLRHTTTSRALIHFVKFITYKTSSPRTTLSLVAWYITRLGEVPLPLQRVKGIPC